MKIDGSVVQGLREDSEDRVILPAIFDIAQALNMKVIAEGVENAEQRARLREMGCEMAQGYYFSEPIPVEEASALFAIGFR